ncbi:MAG: hypothetical protein NC181_03095 [Clostridium sp.]|nr:hypothetical protein [Clostridium sp.]MCM1444222.1 hypothetical protein [Candidatus Amulumruptor caecigallinarius]
MDEYNTILTIKHKNGSIRVFTLQAEDEINIKSIPISKKYEDNWQLIEYDTGKIVFYGSKKKLEFQKELLTRANPNKKYVIINHNALDFIINDVEKKE